MTKIRAPRLLSWYRVVPFLCMMAFGVAALVYAAAPAPLLRLFYPLSHEEQIVDSATRHGVDPYLVAAVIETESGWDEDARSDRGAEGLMQLMPEIPFPGELENLLKTSIAFSDVGNSFDYLRRLYKAVGAGDPDDLKELQAQGFTMREIEILSGVSKSTAARELKES